MKAETSQFNGVLNPVLFNYAKALTLFKIYENELSKDDTLNDQRLQALNEVEALMRECLKKTSVIEEFYCLLEEFENCNMTYKQNEADDDLKKQM